MQRALHGRRAHTAKNNTTAIHNASNLRPVLLYQIHGVMPNAPIRAQQAENHPGASRHPSTEGNCFRRKDTVIETCRGDFQSPAARQGKPVCRTPRRLHFAIFRARRQNTARFEFLISGPAFACSRSKMPVAPAMSFFVGNAFMRSACPAEGRERKTGGNTAGMDKSIPYAKPVSRM